MNEYIKKFELLKANREYWEDIINIDESGSYIADENERWVFDGLPTYSFPDRERGEWIPVSERLPEEGKNVLFCDIDNDIMLGYHLHYAPATHFIERGAWEDIKNVRAWMDLPESYEI